MMSGFVILYMIAVGIIVIGFGIYTLIRKIEARLQWLSDDIVTRVKADYEIKIEELEQKLDQYYISCKLEELCFIGVGGGGCNILEDIAHIDPWHTFIHINSDFQALQQKSSKNKILLGYDKKAGLGSGATAQIVEYLNMIGKEVVVVAILPFSFEGKNRNDVAKTALKEIQYSNKDVIIIENDAVIQKCRTEELGTRETFQYISKSIYQIIIDYFIEH